MKMNKLYTLLIISLMMISTQTNAQCYWVYDDCYPLLLDFAPFTSPICAGSCVTLNPILDPGSSTTLIPHDFSWAASSGAVPAPGLGFPGATTVCPEVNTTYTLTVNSFGPNLMSNGDFSLGTSCFTSAYFYTIGAGTGADPFLDTYGDYYSVCSNISSVTSPSISPFTGAPNMLAFNGATDGRVAYSQSVNVCPGTASSSNTYQFTIDVASWTDAPSPIYKPKLQILINGIPQLTYMIPDFDNWNHLSFTWSSGMTSIALIEIKDLNTQWNYNDFAITNLTFRRMSTSTATTTVNVILEPDACVTEAMIGGDYFYNFSSVPSAGVTVDYIGFHFVPPYATVTPLGCTMTTTVPATYNWYTDVFAACPGAYGVCIKNIHYLGCTWAVPHSASCCAAMRYGSFTGYRNADTSHSTIASMPEQFLTIVPNPNNGTFTLKGSVPGITTTTQATLEIIDILGKTILTDIVQLENGSINKTITLGNDITNGVYMVRFNADGNIKVLKFTLDR